MHNTCCFLTTTVDTRILISVTFILYCLSCSYYCQCVFTAQDASNFTYRLYLFLISYRLLRISVVMFVHPSDRMEQLGSHWTDFR